MILCTHCVQKSPIKLIELSSKYVHFFPGSLNNIYLSNNNLNELSVRIAD